MASKEILPCRTKAVEALWFVSKCWVVHIEAFIRWSIVHAYNRVWRIVDLHLFFDSTVA
jgi:hypothetical protein